MPTLRASPAIERAYSSVKRGLSDGTWKDGDYLPSIPILAKVSGVSRSTMIKAIARIKKEGGINAIERYRMVVGNVNSLSLPAGSQAPSWRKKRTLMEKELLSGNLATQGKLPPVKELQARYGVCFKTIKKILQSMISDGVIQPHGKGYALPEIVKTGYNSKVVFVTCAGHFLQRSALNQEHNRIVNLFESECIRRGLRFEVLEIDFYDPIAYRYLRRKLSDSDRVLGYILDVWWYEPKSFRGVYLDALTQLARFKKPVALLDEIGSFTLPSQHSGNPSIQTFSIEGKRAGERIARYLKRLGHQAVAFFALYPEALWSSERYAGVAGQFSRTGDPGAARIFTDTIRDGFPHLVSAAGLGDSDVGKLIPLGRTPSQARDLNKLWRAFKKNPQKGFVETNPVCANLRVNLARLSGLLHQGFDNAFSSESVRWDFSRVNGRSRKASLRALI